MQCLRVNYARFWKELFDGGLRQEQRYRSDQLRRDLPPHRQGCVGEQLWGAGVGHWDLQRSCAGPVGLKWTNMLISVYIYQLCIVVYHLLYDFCFFKLYIFTFWYWSMAFRPCSGCFRPAGNIQDLLITVEQRPKKGFEIRESKILGQLAVDVPDSIFWLKLWHDYWKLLFFTEVWSIWVCKPNFAPCVASKKGRCLPQGVYIDGITKRPVDCYKAIHDTIEEATANRTVGSTLMNATSSRAHTVLIIEFKTVTACSTRVSMINLVDLAGSEKVKQTGAEGERMKEGAMINKSLFLGF